MNPEDTTPEEMSHVTLLGLLMSMGGSAVVDTRHFDREAIAGPNGWHAIQLEPLDDGARVRVSVHPRPATQEGGVTHL